MSPRPMRASVDPELLLARHRRQRALRRRRRRSALALGIATIAGLSVLVALGGGAAVFAYGSSCNLSSLHEIRIGQNSFVYAANGALLGSIPAERNRQEVKARAMSPWIRKATVAIEDRRFYEHGGIDPEGIARAAVADVRARRVVEGGSTITQQLVRNLYISNQRTVQRKLKEACLATKLDRKWSKQRILTTYLNQVYYGNHAYGIEAVGVISVVHLVEVGRQDPLLRPLPVELRGEARFLELALHRPLVRDVEVSDELLCDRRAALDDPPRPDVGDRGTRDALGVDAAVLVEAAVLDGDRRLADPRRHRSRFDLLAVALGGDRAQKGSARCVD